jgi:ubiquinone biosynthesis protein
VGDFVRREAGPMGRIEDVAEHLRTAANAVGRLPAILDKAEAALDDFHAERKRPRRVWWMWLLALVAILLLWRILA